jgi:putative ABC transport system permease protein
MYTGALVFGVLLSALPLALVGIGFLGRPWASGPLRLLPAVALAVAGVTAAAIEVPTRQSLRIPPTTVLT